MSTLLVCLVPVAVYVVVQGWRDRAALRAALGRVGLGSFGRAWPLAALVFLGLLVASSAALSFVPAEALHAPGVVLAATSAVGAVSVVLAVVGEELLFRGLIGGVLVRRLGFGVGNLLQALVFFAPHLLLLVVAPAVWPVLPVQFAAGWLLGWLRERADSVVPGIAVYAASNLLARVVVGLVA